jgi:hypothetical protein
MADKHSQQSPAKLPKLIKATTRDVRLVGLVPCFLAGNVTLWKIRFLIPNVPFYLDSFCSFENKDRAESFAERWNGRQMKLSLLPPKRRRSGGGRK